MISLYLEKNLNAPSGKLLLQVALEIEQGSLVTLYGESGAGKTSLLRMIAGLMPPAKGHITVRDTKWFDSDRQVNLPPQQRKTGFVFQDYALFPHLTVKENIAFGAKNRDRIRLANDLIETMSLGSLSESKPTLLSGGQQQRVAVARALAQQPEVLLLDEPLSALDAKMRLQLQEYLKEYRKKCDVTILMISHDIGEIHRLSDKVYQLDHGEIIKSGSPEQVLGYNDTGGKFKFKGKVIRIAPNGLTTFITILIGDETIEVISSPEESASLTKGDQVMVVSKAFEPKIFKINE